MPRSARGSRGSTASDVKATPAALLREAETALESGERRQRSGEHAKAIAYFQTVCATLAGMREDRRGCLLWATAMTNLVDLRAPSWNGLSTTDGAPDLHLAASALERGHAAAVAAGAPSEERAHLLTARAECAGLLMESLSLAEDWTAAVRSASEAAKLWEESLTQELAASASMYNAPEASVETLCSLGSASMAFGKLALTGGGAAGLDTTTRRAAQAAVKRALDAFEEACGLCDSVYVQRRSNLCAHCQELKRRARCATSPCVARPADTGALELAAPPSPSPSPSPVSRRGDDLPDVLAQWAQALWDASEVVPPHRRVDLLTRAADTAASSVRLQKVRP